MGDVVVQVFVASELQDFGRGHQIRFDSVFCELSKAFGMVLSDKFDIVEEMRGIDCGQCLQDVAFEVGIIACLRVAAIGNFESKVHDISLELGNVVIEIDDLLAKNFFGKFVFEEAFLDDGRKGHSNL